MSAVLELERRAATGGAARRTASLHHEPGPLGPGWVAASRPVVKRTRAVILRRVIFAVIAVLAGLLATARLTRLVAADRVTLPIRGAIVRRFGPSSALGYFVHCRWCVSMYVAVPVAAAVVWLVPELHRGWWLPTVITGALLALAYSHGTALLAGLEDDE